MRIPTPAPCPDWPTHAPPWLLVARADLVALVRIEDDSSVLRRSADGDLVLSLKIRRVLSDHVGAARVSSAIEVRFVEPPPSAALAERVDAAARHLRSDVGAVILVEHQPDGTWASVMLDPFIQSGTAKNIRRTTRLIAEQARARRRARLDGSRRSTSRVADLVRALPGSVDSVRTSVSAIASIGCRAAPDLVGLLPDDRRVPEVEIELPFGDRDLSPRRTAARLDEVLHCLMQVLSEGRVSCGCAETTVPERTRCARVWQTYADGL